MDTELDRIHLHLDTPCRAGAAGGARGSRGSSLFGSIERGIDRMICMLTPKKKSSSLSDEPRKVKVSVGVTQSTFDAPFALVA